ncbi:MAG: ABC transporter permease [Anaerolineae bacterium]
MGFYLAFKEMWRNRGRFMLISMVIALIAVLVLFTAGLAEGLGNGNREYLEKLNAELVVYKSNVDLSPAASRLDRGTLHDVRQVAGVKDAGQVSFANVAIMLADNKTLNVSLIGVEPGHPGEPPVVTGRGLGDMRANEAILDRNVAIRTKLQVGDTVKVKAIQGTKDEYYDLRVVGISDGRQNFLQPSLIVPALTFDKIKPKGAATPNDPQLVSNIIAVQLENPADLAGMKQRIESGVKDVTVVDRKTAYEATPGYTAQQGTLNTQQVFVLLIGVLVIGGFFQIQMLQKVPQIGVLKAIGATNPAIAVAVVVQIIASTVLGIGIGTLGTLALSLSFPPTIPIIFSPNAIALSVASLMLIGPVGGMVSVQYAVRVEPLTALGLSA